MSCFGKFSYKKNQVKKLGKNKSDIVNHGNKSDIRGTNRKP